MTLSGGNSCAQVEKPHRSEKKMVTESWLSATLNEGTGVAVGDAAGRDPRLCRLF